MKNLLTLVFFVSDNQILLGYKKRGFGSNRWNGFGGKVKDTEGLVEAAKREALEECGLIIESLEKRAVHEFRFQGKEEVLEVHTFLVTQWQGESRETEEMKPRWFLLEEIPYDTMWPDDIFWLPSFLEGKYLRTQFLFGPEDVVLEHTVQEVPKEAL